MRPLNTEEDRTSRLLFLLLAFGTTMSAVSLATDPRKADCAVALLGWVAAAAAGLSFAGGLAAAWGPAHRRKGILSWALRALAVGAALLMAATLRWLSVAHHWVDQ